MIAEIELLAGYAPVLVFLALALTLGLAFVFLPLVLAPAESDVNKNAAYECGFPAFDDARMKFDVQFYLVAILFIVVDLDVAFIFPWALALFDSGLGWDDTARWLAFCSMALFVGVFFIGYIYEWAKGALEWR